MPLSDIRLSTQGYLNRPDETARCIDKDGYFHTGDVVIVDDKGRIYIVDRIKELIKYKGFQVAPAELEGILVKSEKRDQKRIVINTRFL